MAHDEKGNLTRRGLLTGTAAAAGALIAGRSNRGLADAPTGETCKVKTYTNADFYDADGKFLAEQGTRDSFGHAQLGGAAPVVANMIKDALGYKFHWAVADYLQRAARHLASESDVEQAYALGREKHKSRRWLEAIVHFEKVLALDPSHKDVQELLAEASQQKKLQDLYTQAKRSFRSKHWTEAIEWLQQIASLQEGYRDAARLLERARLQAQLDKLYMQGQRAWEAGQHAEARVLHGHAVHEDVVGGVVLAEGPAVADLFAVVAGGLVAVVAVGDDQVLLGGHLLHHGRDDLRVGHRPELLSDVLLEQLVDLHARRSLNGLVQ